MVYCMFHSFVKQLVKTNLYARYCTVSSSSSHFVVGRETDEWVPEPRGLVAIVGISIESTQEGHLPKFWRSFLVVRSFCIALVEIS